MTVACVVRGLCDELITRPGESYGVCVWSVYIVCGGVCCVCILCGVCVSVCGVVCV